MNIVTRGLMAAGMAVFATMHALQVLDPPADAPGWLTVGFAAVTVAAAVLAVRLITASNETIARWQVAAVVLAGASAAALVLAVTVGFLGVVEPALRYEVVMSFVAEAVVIGAFVVSRVLPPETEERADDRVAPLSTRG